jgi:hypothetical protein
VKLPKRIECALHKKRDSKGSHQLGLNAFPCNPPRAAGRVPRIARLLALAHKFDGLLRQGVIADYATLARLGHVSRARITQILNLLNLAPDIQEEILFMPLTLAGHDPVPMRRLRVLAQTLDWRCQRTLWRRLYPGPPEIIHGLLTCQENLDCHEP